MSAEKISVNQRGWNLAEKLLNEQQKYDVSVRRNTQGVTIVDTGISVPGSLETGRLVTEICLGGYGEAKIAKTKYTNDFTLDTISVQTNYPAISALGSQFADWQIKEDDYFAIGSGPARALIRKNRQLYEEIGYRDESDRAVLVLETTKDPPEKVTQRILNECNVQPGGLILILAPTTSIVGCTQVSGRIVETGLHKLLKLGFDPKLAVNARGSAPIAPVHKKFAEAMGRTNDAILYMGETYYEVEGAKDEELRQIIEKAPSSASPQYGRPFLQVFKEANFDFYKVDPNLFAPAVVTVKNLETGAILKAGKINLDVFRHSIGLLS